MLIIYMRITTDDVASSPTSIVVHIMRSGRTSAEEILVNDGSGPTDTTPVQIIHLQERDVTQQFKRLRLSKHYHLQPHNQKTYRPPKQWLGKVGRKAIHISKSRTMESIQKLKTEYPWIQTPLVVGAPMRLIALADLAVAISKAGTY